MVRTSRSAGGAGILGMPGMMVALIAAGALFLDSPASLSAQSKAKAENVATIPHTSVPNFFKLPPDLYFGEGIGIAVRKEDQGLRWKLNRALDDIRADGTYDQLSQRYFGFDIYGG